MNYLTYSPSIEAYVDVSRDGGHKYYDISQDITSASIERAVDDSSSFSIKLSNKNRKYNGLFQSMDRITIYASKTERYRLLTGYITDVDAFKLYSGDFSISGRCSLYQLQRKYWDPGLEESQRLVFLERSNPWSDGGYWRSVYNLLVEVGGWDANSIAIQSELPKSVIDWAYGIYQSQANDIELSQSIIRAFDDVLKTHGPKMSSSSQTAATPGATAASGTTAESGGNVSGGDGNASSAQSAIVSKATSGTVPGNYGWCLKWVGDVYESAGYPFERYWGAIDVWRNRQSHDAYGKKYKKP